MGAYNFPGVRAYLWLVTARTKKNQNENAESFHLNTYISPGPYSPLLGPCSEIHVAFAVLLTTYPVCGFRPNKGKKCHSRVFPSSRTSYWRFMSGNQNKIVYCRLRPDPSTPIFAFFKLTNLFTVLFLGHSIPQNAKPYWDFCRSVTMLFDLDVVVAVCCVQHTRTSTFSSNECFLSF